jgi:hypothetical protein
VLVVIAATLVVSALAGVGWAHLNTPTASALQAAAPAPAGSPAAADALAPQTPVVASPVNDYQAIVTHLLAMRARAFARCKPGWLRRVYLAPTFVLDMDHAAVRALCSQRLHTVGFTQHVVSIKTEDYSSNTVELWVTDLIPAYRIVNARGHLVARRVARRQRFEMSLERTHGRWLVTDLGKKLPSDPAG